MPLTWNVQPYAFLEELRENYTTTVTQATRNKSTSMAKEAEAWMKANAPWQDKDIFGPAVYGPRQLLYPAGTARKGLSAFVVTDKNERATEMEARARAASIDRKNLKASNDAITEMRGKAKERAGRLIRSDTAQAVSDRYDLLTAKYGAVGRKVSYRKTMNMMRQYYQPEEQDRLNRAEGRRLKLKVERQRRYKKKRSVPVGTSATRAFEKQWRGTRRPLVDVRFKHKKDLTYSIWLEIAHGGKWNIIAKTMNHWGPKFMFEIARIARLKQYRDNLARLGIRPEPPSPEVTFAKHVATRTAEKGYQYEPWSAARQARRAQRRSEWNEKAKATRRQAQEFSESKAFSEPIEVNDSLAGYNTFNPFQYKQNK